MIAGLSLEMMEARIKWHNIFQVLKEKLCQPRNLYTAKISFRNESEIKIFLDKEKLKLSITLRPIIKEWLKEVL